jgi:RNA polymerase sigma-70 factor (ECF subfamily)
MSAPAEASEAEFDALARIHGPRLRTVALRVTRCHEAAAEVVQDVFLRLWRDRQSLEIREHLAGYLATAVRNRAIDLARRRRRESRWIERESAEREQAESERIRGDAGAVPEFVVAGLAAALATLPAKRREIMLLRWRDELSYADIARRLGISAKTVENQISRGLKALRASLGD